MPGDAPDKGGRWCDGTDRDLTEGKDHADDHTVEGAEEQYAEESNQKDEPFIAADLPELVRHFGLQNTKQGSDHDAGQDRYRQIL